MATTIQVSEQTKNMLEMLKEQRHAATFEMLLKEMVRKELGIPKSRFGSTPNITPFTEKERARLHEL